MEQSNKESLWERGSLYCIINSCQTCYDKNDGFNPNRESYARFSSLRTSESEVRHAEAHRAEAGCSASRLQIRLDRPPSRVALRRGSLRIAKAGGGGGIGSLRSGLRPRPSVDPSSLRSVEPRGFSSLLPIDPGPGAQGIQSGLYLAGFGGGGGIRTPGQLAPSSDFKSGALNHSATPPYVIIYKFIRQHKCLFRSLEAGSCISGFKKSTRVF